MVNSSVSTVMNATVDEGNFQRDLYRVVVPMMLSACLLAAFLNILILLSAHWVRRSLSPTLYFSLSLALTDAYNSIILGTGLIINSLLPIVYSVYFMGSFYRCSALILEAFRMTGLMVSVLHLLALAVNHYIGILRPLHYAATVTRRGAGITIIIMWIVPVVFFFIYFSSVPGQGFLSLRCQNMDFLIYRTFHLTVSLLFFFPLILLSFIYVHIYLVVRQHQRGLLSFPSARQFHKNVKAIITTLLILGTYLLGWIPAVFTFVLICKDCVIPFHTVSKDILLGAAIFSNAMIVLKCLINPIIYAARMPEIKEALKVMFNTRCGLNMTSTQNSLLSRTDTFTSSLRLISFRRDCYRNCNSGNGNAVTTYVDRTGTIRLQLPHNNHYPL
ncbi:adrenocorticotropic hormone receptor-like [Centruroides vittatus]|uniref:adrenocorticotropic hormone receptor-like n=1 Tax=Centruroides vittatus TaxID=120091 RepID=UPI003510733F